MHRAHEGALSWHGMLANHLEELGRQRGGAGYDVVIGDAAAHVRGLRGAGLGCVLLDAFDRDGETPAHLLTADGFLRDAYDALAAGGTLVVNRFNGVDGSAGTDEWSRSASVDRCCTRTCSIVRTPAGDCV